MRRVVITGIGIWSCIGQDVQSVTESLRTGRSGVVFDKSRIDFGLRSGLIGAVPHPNLKTLLARKFRANLFEDSEYAYMAVRQALEQAGMDDEYRKIQEIGIIMGNDGNSSILDSLQINADGKNIVNEGVSTIFNASTSSTTMNLATIFSIRGVNFSISAACASSSHAVGMGMILVRQGLADVMVVGGAMETRPHLFAGLDFLEADSLRNESPTQASRPFDKDRDGMVPSGGAAALVLEEYDHAVARGATILAEVCGYGFSSNGLEDISSPSADAEYIAMKRALDDAGLQPSDIDYVNAHGTSTIIGDIEEAKALTRLFVDGNTLITHNSSLINRKPFISSTKSMTGHENWMAGASEAVYSILMMQNNFVAPNINLENVIDEAKDLNIVRETVNIPINTVLSNSSGMGGTNSALVFRKIGS